MFGAYINANCNSSMLTRNFRCAPLCLTSSQPIELPSGEHNWWAAACVVSSRNCINNKCDCRVHFKSSLPHRPPTENVCWPICWKGAKRTISYAKLTLFVLTFMVSTTPLLTNKNMQMKSQCQILPTFYNICQKTARFYITRLTRDLARARVKYQSWHSLKIEYFLLQTCKHKANYSVFCSYVDFWWNY